MGVLLMKSHLQSYPCPLQINFFWNLGFLLGITIILQIITGIFLALHYTSDINSAYSSLFFFIREILLFFTIGLLPFFPFILLKDFFGFILILCLYFLQTHFGVSSFSHPDSALEVCGLLTPLHIVPEWYFLCQYAILKAVPNKNAGFIILFTSIFTFFIFGEIRNLTTLCVLPLVNNGFSLSSFFLSLLLDG